MKETNLVLAASILAAGIVTGCGGPGRGGGDNGDARASQRNVPDFSPDSAFSYLLKQVGFGPRDPGSVGHERCLNFLQMELRRSAEAVNLQPFTLTGEDGKLLRLNNIIASFNSKATTRVLLIAHWDTRPWADNESDTALHNTPIAGANDGASGVAVLLEIARHLGRTPPPVGVDILLTDGEDYGRHGDPNGFLHGARYFAKNLPKGYMPVYGILLDMVGDRDLELMIEPNSKQFAPDIVQLVWSRAKLLGVAQFSERVQAPVTDDHLPLNRVGIKTIDLIDFDYPDASNRYWHTLQDTPDKCSPESLEAVGRVVMDLLYNYPG